MQTQTQQHTWRIVTGEAGSIHGHTSPEFGPCSEAVARRRLAGDVAHYRCDGWGYLELRHEASREWEPLRDTLTGRMTL